MAHWSEFENLATVDAYFRMLTAHLRGAPLVKNEFYRDVYVRLGGSRSLKAVERKFQNVSAVLFSEFRIFMPGIAPARNAQRSLYTAVESYLATHPETLDSITVQVRRSVPAKADLFWELPEIDTPTIEIPGDSDWRFTGRKVDFVAIEARNRSLGLAGELAVLESERRRLARLGHESLALRVEHVSQTRGDGLGFDILSFDASGRERYLEVKTSRLGRTYPFYASRNEVEFSHLHAENFEVHRVFDFERSTVGKFVLSGDLRESCDLDPAQFLARPRAC